ncbi:hypothetical protein WJX72_004923 [[Myrmecia] bisecta]|uniref:Uncharacterized protein n=1 Tax=[Myrmecia] bisecta TaxID=41462 RepID=A0AAW1Q7C2_9CHLO
MVAERKAGRKVLTSTGGSGDDAQHAFGWRDAMDLVVKWRQLSEPNDQVVWVDLLTRKEFEAGFGSHTPIYSGQTKCVRYYMNFERGFSLFKDILIKEGHSFDASNNPVPLGGDQKRADIAAAKTAEELWQVIGVDSWAVVHIESCSRAGHSMEGTRLTLVKLRNQPDAYEFSIRTPVTPPRWQDYDQELSVMWEATMAALVDGDLPLVAQSALRYAYYWYNFMPLARGTAVVGYITLLGLFMAAGMPVTASIPKNYQDVLSSMRHRLEALNGLTAPRI